MGNIGSILQDMLKVSHITYTAGRYVELYSLTDDVRAHTSCPHLEAPEQICKALLGQQQVDIIYTQEHTYGVTFSPWACVGSGCAQDTVPNPRAEVEEKKRQALTLANLSLPLRQRLFELDVLEKYQLALYTPEAELTQHLIAANFPWQLTGIITEVQDELMGTDSPIELPEDMTRVANDIGRLCLVKTPITFEEFETQLAYLLDVNSETIPEVWQTANIDPLASAAYLNRLQKW